MKLVISCEHGGNYIPKEFQKLFVDVQPVLETHRGYDPGALDLFYTLSKLADFSTEHKISRLLIEVNRSLHHPQLFSEITKDLSPDIKNSLIDQYYLPYRKNLENKLAEMISQGEEVLHISVHSFTPVLNGAQRRADIGLLYDPARINEKKYSVVLKREILKHYPGLKVRFNYPYLGKADGFTTFLRKKFPDNYSGIELEVNQRFSPENKIDQDISAAIYEALEYLK